MKIALVAVDGHSGFPNLALMRLSAWHKAQGDAVEWWNGFTHYDRAYLSKVFTFTPDFEYAINADGRIFFPLQPPWLWQRFSGTAVPLYSPLQLG